MGKAIYVLYQGEHWTGNITSGGKAHRQTFRFILGRLGCSFKSTTRYVSAVWEGLPAMPDDTYLVVIRWTDDAIRRG